MFCALSYCVLERERVALGDRKTPGVRETQACQQATRTLRDLEKSEGTKSEAHPHAAVCLRLPGSPILLHTPMWSFTGLGLPPALSESSRVQGVTKPPVGSLGRSSRTKTSPQ